MDAGESTLLDLQPKPTNHGRRFHFLSSAVVNPVGATTLGPEACFSLL